MYITFSLGFIGCIFLGMGYLMRRSKGEAPLLLTPKKKEEMKQKAQQQDAAATKPPKKSEEEIAKEEEKRINDILKLEILELDLGYGLLKLADSDLIERIRSMRRNIANDLGFLMPKIRIRDNLQLPPNVYNFKLKGIVIGSSEVYPDKFMAMSDGMVSEEIEGIPTKEPAFGYDALWIDASAKEDAMVKGYIPIEPAAVISTHMSELVRQNASELLTRQETQNILDKLKEDYPVLVDDTLRVASVGLIQKILKSLLKDNIPIKDMLSILEAIGDMAEYTKNLDMLIEYVRKSLSRVITSMYSDENGQLNFYILNSADQQKLIDALQLKDGSYNLMLNVAQTSAVVTALRDQRDKKPITQNNMVLCVESSIRKFISDICSQFGIDIVVLSFAEISPNTPFETLGVINIENL